jgi:hypothetical protein
MKMNTIKKRILSRETDRSAKGHTNEVLCLALSDDFKFLVSKLIFYKCGHRGFVPRVELFQKIVFKISKEISFSAQQ